SQEAQGGEEPDGTESEDKRDLENAQDALEEAQDEKAAGEGGQPPKLPELPQGGGGSGSESGTGAEPEAETDILQNEDPFAPGADEGDEGDDTQDQFQRDMDSIGDCVWSGNCDDLPETDGGITPDSSLPSPDSFDNMLNDALGLNDDTANMTPDERFDYLHGEDFHNDLEAAQSDVARAQREALEADARGDTEAYEAANDAFNEASARQRDILRRRENALASGSDQEFADLRSQIQTDVESYRQAFETADSNYQSNPNFASEQRRAQTLRALRDAENYQRLFDQSYRNGAQIDQLYRSYETDFPAPAGQQDASVNTGTQNTSFWGDIWDWGTSWFSI
ncbi:MAG: hypothetical protein AAFO91_17605, partial [Bacteroidota bacterium]